MFKNRLNAYHVMWMFVMFDLPTDTKEDRKRYAKFRKGIMRNGFTMVQFSVYSRYCASKESRDVHLRRIKDLVPPYGHISVVTITDKQYGDIVNVLGKKRKPLKTAPAQLELF